MVKVGTLQYEISADTRKFQQGMTATQKELRAAKKVFRETEEPAARYGRKVDELDRLHRKGLISSKQYAAALKKEKAALDKVNMTAKDTSKSFGGLGASVKSTALGFVAIGTAQRAFALLREEMDRIDEIAKTSRFLGIATDQLIGLRHAAEQTAGVSGGQLSIALQRMTRRISEAAAGAGEAQAAIKELGLDAVALNRMDAAEAFKAIADSMQDVEAESDRVRLAFKLFDSEGARLALTLQGGSESLNAYVKAAQDLGMTFTDEEAANIEAANDAIDDLNKSIKALATTFATDLAPELKQATEMLKTIATLRGADRSTFSGASGAGALDTALGFARYGSLGAAAGGLDAMRKQYDAIYGKPSAPGVANGPAGIAGSGAGVAGEIGKGLNIAVMEAERRAKLEEQIARDREESERQNKAIRDEVNKRQLDAAQKQVEAAAGALQMFEKSQKNLGSIPDAASFSSGSRGEYEFLRQRQVQEQERAERRRSEEKADRQRQQHLDALGRAEGLLERIKDRINPSVGV